MLLFRRVAAAAPRRVPACLRCLPTARTAFGSTLQSQEQPVTTPNYKRVEFSPAEDAFLAEIPASYGYNWQRIARAVNERFGLDRHPQVLRDRYEQQITQVYTSARFTPAEDRRIQHFLQGWDIEHPGKRKNWSELEREMPGRSRSQLRRRGWVLTERKGGFKFSNDEKQQLVELVQKLGTRWQEIADTIGNGKTRDACKLTYTLMYQAFNHGLWAPEEVTKLTEAVEQSPDRQWKAISEKVGTRSPVQCRNFYIRHIEKHPKPLKWTAEEEQQLMSLAETNLTWNEVATMLGTRRTPHACVTKWKLLKRTLAS
ncbi:hypothetical protein RI367_003032 [Sorochytrium milnesiophthora]